jgi:hypothetical protein
LLHHLEATWTQIAGDHLLAAVTLSCARRWFHDRFVARYFNEIARIQFLQCHVQVHDNVGPFQGFVVLLSMAAKVEAKIAEKAGERV